MKKKPHSDRGRPHRLLAVVALVTVFLGSRSARAQSSASAHEAPTADTTAPSSEPPEGYREIIDEAVAEFAAGHHAEARALFRRAHDMFPNARTLRGIGMCSFELREYADAIRALSAALSEQQRALPEDQRAQVSGTLARAEAFVGRFELALPEGATVHVDDAAAPAPLEDGGVLLLSLGAHTVSARRDGATVRAVRVEVRGGERERLVIAPEAAPVTTASPPRETASGAPDLTAAIAVLSTGAALAVAGIAVLAVGLADRASVEGAARGTSWSSLEGAYGRAPILEGIGAATLAGGAALVTLGAVLLATAGPAAGPRDASVSIAPALGGLELRGSF